MLLEFPGVTQLTETTNCPNTVCRRIGQKLTAHGWQRFNITNVVNPPVKTITPPISLKSYTKDGFLIEQIDDFLLNFQCAAPCKTCLGKSNRICETCETTGKYLLYEGMCYTKCPKGLYLEGITCMPCKPACKECLSWEACTSCNSDAVLANERCPYKLAFPYLMPCLVVGLIWIGFATYVECRKKSSRWIPLVLAGVSLCNKVLAIIELFLFSAYNMPKLFVYTILTGIVIPFLLSSLFILGWFYKFRHDLNVKRNYDNFRIFHISLLGMTFLGDYRSWKYIYTNINNHTRVLAFKVQFKYFNRGFSFACLISDCVLCFVGVSAFT